MTEIMKRKSLIAILCVLLVLIGISLSVLLLSGKKEISYEIIDDKSIRVISSPSDLFKDGFYCIDDNPVTDDQCKWLPYDNDSFTIQGNDRYIHLKDAKGNIYELNSEKPDLLYINIDKDLYPMYPVDKKIELNINVNGIGHNDLNMSSSDESIVAIENNVLVCKKPGTATIRVGNDNVSDSVDIIVTDLYTLPDENSDHKPILKETICTSEEAHMLDEVLSRKIEEAGYQTRAGVVAAARFLALEFPYKLAYFAESGRLDPAFSTKCDGEGRYYHKGLYLSEDKYADISASVYGPKYWGLFFKEDTTEDHSKDDYYLVDGFKPSDIGSDLYLSKRPNGLDCSGHVSWCYYNGGFDLGDLGAGGPGSHGMNELGELVMIDEELLKSDRIKAGDLVGFASHIGIVIGVDENYIWISDTMISGIKNVRYERTLESFNQLGENSWRYFMLMDSEYKEDGNYTPMW